MASNADDRSCPKPLLNPDAASEIVAGIVQKWQLVSDKGAFIFDIDETILNPDEVLIHDSSLTQSLTQLIEKGLMIAFISGSPWAVVENRLLNPLTRVLSASGHDLDKLSFYVNGGSSKLIHLNNQFIEDTAFTEKNLISADYIHRVKELLTDYLYRRFDLSKERFDCLLEAWQKKRQEQWGKCEVEFDTRWSEKSGWEMAFLDDREMAAIKAGQRAGKTSYPFINTRRTQKNNKDQITGVAGFTPSGFYALSQAAGDGIDLDIRDWIIERLKQDMGALSKELILRKAGRSSIDITKRGTDKASAVKDFLETRRRTEELCYYFGDEFFPGGNDSPILEDEALKKRGLHLMALNKEEPIKDKRLFWLGTTHRATHLFLAQLAESLREHG